MVKHWKKQYCLFIALFISCIIPTTAFADTAPKPSINITFTGIEGECYYATLLSKQESTGPASAYNGTNAYYAEDTLKAKQIWQKFVDYEDPEGFYFLQWFWDCSKENAFTWGYYPPETFEVLLYFPEYNTYMKSEICERYAFDSYYTMDLSGVNLEIYADSESIPIVAIQKSYDYYAEILSVIARIFITIVIELGIAVVFAFRGRKQLLFLAAVNIMTQVLLNVSLNVIDNSNGWYAFLIFYILLEAIVFVAEAVVYTIFLPRMQKELAVPTRRKTIIYALTANLSSFIIGLWLAHLLPGLY